MNTTETNIGAKKMKLLPIELIKNADGSVSGMLPSGLVCTWDKYSKNKPDKRYKKIMLNCYYWKPVWVDKFSESVIIKAFKG